MYSRHTASRRARDRLRRVLFLRIGGPPASRRGRGMLALALALALALVLVLALALALVLVLQRLKEVQLVYHSLDPRYFCMSHNGIDPSIAP